MSRRFDQGCSIGGNFGTMARWLTMCLLAFPLNVSCAPAISDQNVQIRLIGVGSIERTLIVPVQLLGPRGPGLAESARAGGSFKMIPLAVTYPELGPWSHGVPEPGERRLYALLMLTVSDGIQRYIDYQKENARVSEITLDEASGLTHFLENAPRKEPIIRAHTLYSEAYHVVMICNQYVSQPIENSKCDLRFSNDKNIMVLIKGLTWSERLQWEQYKAKFLVLVRTLLVAEK
jgi:hypothetical protein